MFKKLCLLTKKNFIKVSLLTLIIAVNITSTSLAYTHLFGALKFEDQYNITYSYEQWGSYNYSSYVTQAINAWNNSAARIYVKSTNERWGDIRIISTDWGTTGWHGHCTAPSILNPNISTIKINDRYRSSFISDQAELIAHELGHSFTLGHSGNDTLMRAQGYRKSAIPTTDDVKGVNAKY